MRGFRHYEMGDQTLWNVREVEKKRVLAVGDAGHPDTTYGRQSLWVLKLDSMGCVTSGCAVSIEEQQKRPTSGFSVRPNPNEGRFRVPSAREEGRYRGTLSVRDAQGRLLYQRRLEGQYPFEKRVGLPEASPGVHFVAWKDRNGRYVRKMVVR